jgi:hypothetical protein
MARDRRRSRIDASDLAGYGSVANGTVNVGKAARGLGASKTEVRRRGPDESKQGWLPRWSDESLPTPTRHGLIPTVVS